MTATRTTRRELIPSLCRARFAVRNLGCGTVTGEIPVIAGSVETAPDGTPLTVRASLDLGSLTTGNARRDHDLRTPSLLDLDRYPTLEFTGRPERAAQEPDARGWTVRGTLEAHGARVPITLAAEAVEGSDGPAGVTTIRASGEFDRRDLSIRAPRIIIGRRVRVLLEVALGPAPQAP